MICNRNREYGSTGHGDSEARVSNAAPEKQEIVREGFMEGVELTLSFDTQGGSTGRDRGRASGCGDGMSESVELEKHGVCIRQRGWKR